MPSAMTAALGRGARRRPPAAALSDAAGIAACGARALRAPRARPDRGRSSAAALRCRGRRRLDGATRRQPSAAASRRSEEHTSELQSRRDLVCRLLLEKKKKIQKQPPSETQKKKKK